MFQTFKKYGEMLQGERACLNVKSGGGGLVVGGGGNKAIATEAEQSKSSQPIISAIINMPVAEAV